VFFVLLKVVGVFVGWYCRVCFVVVGGGNLGLSVPECDLRVLEVLSGVIFWVSAGSGIWSGRATF